MELYDLIPDNSDCWVIRGNFLFFRKLEHIPICTIIEGIPYILLDARIHRQVLKLTKKIIKLGVEFYFTTPLISNPKGVDNFNAKVIENYIYNYSNKYFFHGFHKIDFDLIRNMVKWTEKENCFDLVKEIFDRIEKSVNQVYWDYYSKRQYYEYDEDIRQSFSGLYRDIQINKIL